MLKRLREYLDQNNIKYQLINHSAAFTSQEIAASAHIPGREMAKVVMIKVDNKLEMAVLPASHTADLKRIKEVRQAHNVELAQESDYKDIFEESEAGAMPPFGNLFNLRVISSTDLSEDSQIVFNAGSHRELIKLSYEDYERLVQPLVCAFSIKKFGK